MKNNNNKSNRRVTKINGVHIVNAENSKKEKQPPKKSTVTETGSPSWIEENQNTQM